MPTEPAGTLPAEIEMEVSDMMLWLATFSLKRRPLSVEKCEDFHKRLYELAEAAYAAGQAEPCYCCREDGDQFGCHDGCACHAAVKAASSPRPSGEGEGGRP